jgi:putative selenium metabolism protein SsnA
MIILHGRIVTWDQPNQILENDAILIRGDQIVEIAPSDQMIRDNSHEEIIDAHNQYVMPGNICAHTHFYGAFSRGMAIPGNPAQDFPEILAKLWWPLDQSLTLEDVKYSTLVCLIDAIRHGTTTLIDHHASPNAIEGSLDLIADAVLESGLRTCLCYEVTDRGGMEKAKAGIDENGRFIEKMHHDDGGGRLAGLFGLHAGLTLSDETLDRCREAVPADVGFHIHVAEHPVDEYDSLAKSGLRVVDRLAQHQILNDHSIVAHAVHIDTKEVNLLTESQTWVSHQPRSNMNNAVGIAQIESMLRAGVKVCLGNDGFSNAMWEEWKAAYFAHKLWNLDPRRMPGNIVAEIAVENNARMASQIFNRSVGVIRPGALADLIFVDYHPFTELNAGNLPWHIIFGFNESMITTTIASGKILMKDRVVLSLDEEEIAQRAMELSKAVWKRYNEQF